MYLALAHEPIEHGHRELLELIGVGTELGRENRFVVVLDVDDVRATERGHDLHSEPAHALPRRERVHQIRPAPVWKSEAPGARIGVRHDGKVRASDIRDRLRIAGDGDRWAEPSLLQAARKVVDVEGTVPREVAMTDEEHGLYRLARPPLHGRPKSRPSAPVFGQRQRLGKDARILGVS
jgi:hypothetical protein